MMHIKSTFMLVLSHFSHVQLFVTLSTAAHQTTLANGILQARILESVAYPSPDLPDPGVKLTSPVSPALQVNSLPTEPRGKINAYSVIKLLYYLLPSSKGFEDWQEILFYFYLEE